MTRTTTGYQVNLCSLFFGAHSLSGLLEDDAAAAQEPDDIDTSLIDEAIEDLQKAKELLRQWHIDVEPDQHGLEMRGIFK